MILSHAFMKKKKTPQPPQYTLVISLSYTSCLMHKPAKCCNVKKLKSFSNVSSCLEINITTCYKIKSSCHLALILCINIEIGDVTILKTGWVCGNKSAHLSNSAASSVCPLGLYKCLFIVT